MSTDERNLPWIEKYRPAQLDDLISHQDIVGTIQKFLGQGRLPHLLFYGPPGTGKTSTILAIAKQLYGPKEFASMVLELNASDDRGIGVVRNEVLSFASTRTIFNRGFKLVILDEADAMTKDAQNALRRIIEKFTENTRFCLVCNYLNKIIPAIQSRCTRFRFAPLAQDQMSPRLAHVAAAEHVALTPDGTQALLTLGKGDMRRVLNILQCTSMSFDEVNEDNVYSCVGQPLRSDIRACLQWMLNEEISVAVGKIQQLKTLKGLALSDMLTELHLLVLRLQVPTVARLHVVERMAEIEMRLSSGASERLQLSALVAAFSQTKEHLLKLKEDSELAAAAAEAES